MLKEHYSKVLFKTLSLVLMAGCASSPSPHLEQNANSLLQTRVAILPECPLSQVNAGREGVASAVLSPLVAPLVDTIYSTAVTALNEASGERKVEFTGQTTGQFYTVRIEPHEPLATDTVVLNHNIMNACVVVVHGYFSNDPLPDEINKNGIGHFSASAMKSLNTLFGLTTSPPFYYEGRFVYSTDRTSFRISTAALLSSARMMDHKPALRNLSLTFTFTKPDSGKATPFAVGTINLGPVKDAIFIDKNPLLGSSTANLTVQSALGTGYMPLPALDTMASTALTTAQSRVETMRKDIDTHAVKLDALEIDGFTGPNPSYRDAGDWVGAFVDQFNNDATRSALGSLLEATKLEIERLKKGIERLRMETDDKLVAARIALDDARNPLQGAAAAARALQRQEELMARKNELSAREDELLRMNTRKADLEALRAAAPDLAAKLARVNQDKGDFTYFQPYSLTVLLDEVRPPNRALAFMGSWLGSKGAREGVTTALKEELDPITRRELEEKATKAAEDRVVARDSARTEALTAVLDYRGTEITMESLAADADIAVRHTAMRNMELKRLAAEIACRKARDLEVAPSGCSAFQ